jgi:hypothetical protein
VTNEEDASERSAIDCPSPVATPDEIAAPPFKPPAHEEPIIGDVKTAAVDTPLSTTMDAVQVATEAASAAREVVEVIKDSLSYTEAKLFNVAEVLEEATLPSDATKIDDARALKYYLEATLLSQRREEAKLRMAFFLASQAEAAAINSATPGGAIFNRDDQHQLEALAPPVAPTLLAPGPNPQANKVPPNRRSSRIQGLVTPLPFVPGQSVYMVESLTTPIPLKPRPPGQYSQESIQNARVVFGKKHKVPHSSNGSVEPL